MTVYLDLVMILNFLVDLLLLIGVNRLCGYPPGILRCCFAAAVGGIYAGLCIVPSLSFLGNTLWRFVFLIIMALISFGINQSALRRGVVFAFLSMALGGIAMGLNRNSFLPLIFAAMGLTLMCHIGFHGRIGAHLFATVELKVKGQKYRLIALRDTGNTLKDPVTGQRVLIVGSDVAQRVMGLTAQQLTDPISTVESGTVPGVRLMPYRAVGQPCGMLLAYSFDEVKIDGVQSGKLVAFSPDRIGRDGAYQALTGGVL